MEQPFNNKLTTEKFYFRISFIIIIIITTIIIIIIHEFAS